MESLFISVLGAFIFTFLTYLGKRAFWRINFNFRTPILSPSIFNSNYEKNESLPNLALPYGDAFSLPIVFKRFFKKQHDNIFFFPKEASDICNNSSKDLIIIGGPKYNLASKLILSKLHENKLVPFQFARIVLQEPDTGDSLKRFIRVFDRIPSERTECLISNDHEYFDTGTVIYTKNPYSVKGRVLLFAGMSSFSTLIASYFLSKPQLFLFLLYSRLRYIKGFQIIFHVKRINDFEGKIVKKSVFPVKSAE
jgi:hypothetical protein